MNDHVLARVREFARIDLSVLHPPVRVAFDAIAPQSHQLAGARSGKYPCSMVNTLQRLWTLTAGLYRLPVLNANPNARHELERQYRAALAHFRAHEAAPRAMRAKARVLERLITPTRVRRFSASRTAAATRPR